MKRIPLTFALAIIAAVTVAGCKKKDQPQEKLLPVKVAPVAIGHIATTMKVMGTIDSKVHAWINATSEGSIQSLSVREGSRVGEGQILCYIMPSESQNMLGQARLEYEKAKSAFNGRTDEEAKLKLKDAEREFELAKNLFKRVPVVAPVSGTVISKTIENGSTVTIKQPLIEIADLGRLIVKTSVSEDSIFKLRPGQNVKIILYADAEKTFPGRISLITPGVNYQTRTATIEIAIPQRSDIMPGMTCAVEFITAEKSGVIVIPLESIIADLEGNKKVFIVKDGKAVSTPVVTGIEDNTRTEIVSGLNIGDELVIMGHENLKHGVKVKIAKPMEKKKGKESGADQANQKETHSRKEQTP